MKENPTVADVAPAAVDTAPPPRPSHRFAHVDTLRAVAALLVALAHLSERFSPLARASGRGLSFPALARVLNFGRLGVLLFFAVSGFVIQASLRGPREHAGRRFVIARFFRLYPAYWLSLGLGLLVFWQCRGQTFGPALILANATMLPRLLRAPLVLGVYWTLETELAFYALCWALWRGGWLENRRVLAGLVAGFCVAWLGLRGLIQAHALPAGLPAPWKALPRHLALMCWGSLFRVVYEETGGFRARLAGNRQVWLLAGLGLLLMGLDGPRGFHVSFGRSPLGPSASCPGRLSPAPRPTWLRPCSSRSGWRPGGCAGRRWPGWAASAIRSTCFTSWSPCRSPPSCNARPTRPGAAGRWRFTSGRRSC